MAHRLYTRTVGLIHKFNDDDNDICIDNTTTGLSSIY